jgi:calcineurin-like phosphoesterase family protein
LSEQIWFTSDEHYGHENIIKFCNRPFKDTTETRETLISNHNKLVKPGDRVYHLGDMFWRTLSENECIAILSRLNGQHFYILGNHEEAIKKYRNLRSMFQWVKETENLKIFGYPNVWLSHYAHRVWNGSHKGSYHLYGHSHAVLPEDGSLSFDAGVDAQNFYPISLDEVHSKMQKKLEVYKSKKFFCKVCPQNFTASDSNPKTCSKCGSEMELR